MFSHTSASFSTNLVGGGYIGRLPVHLRLYWRCVIYLERIYVIYAQLNLVWPSTWHVLCKLPLLLEAVSDKWWISTHSMDIYNVARGLSIKQCINIGLGIMYITYSR